MGGRNGSNTEAHNAAIAKLRIGMLCASAATLVPPAQQRVIPFRARSAQADAKQHLTIGAAHLDTVVVVVEFNRERGEEQLTVGVGMLARRVIVGKLHANFVADALAPEIPVEVIVGQGKLLSTQKNGREERPRCPSSGRYLARNAAF